MCKKRVASKEETVRLSLFSKWHHFCQMFWQQKGLAIFAITVDFSVRHSRCGHIILNDYLCCKLYRLYAVFKEAFPMPQGRVATRVAKANAKSLCCHSCSLFTCFNTHKLKVSQYCKTRLFQRLKAARPASSPLLFCQSYSTSQICNVVYLSLSCFRCCIFSVGEIRSEVASQHSSTFPRQG